MQQSVFAIRFSLRVREELFYPGENILTYRLVGSIRLENNNLKQYNLSCPIIYEYTPAGVDVYDYLPIERSVHRSAMMPYGYILVIDSSEEPALAIVEFLVREWVATDIINETTHDKEHGYFDALEVKPFIFREWEENVLHEAMGENIGYMYSLPIKEDNYPLEDTYGVLDDVFLSYSDRNVMSEIVDSTTLVDFRRKNNVALNIFQGITASSDFDIDRGRSVYISSSRPFGGIIVDEVEIITLAPIESHTLVRVELSTSMYVANNNCYTGGRFNCNGVLFYPKQAKTVFGRITIM